MKTLNLILSFFLLSQIATAQLLQSESKQSESKQSESKQSLSDKAIYSFLYYQHKYKVNDVEGDFFLCNSMLQIASAQTIDMIKFRAAGDGILNRKIDEAMAKYPELIIPEDQYNPHVYATYDWAKEMDLERAAKIRKCDIRKPTKHAPFSAESFTNMIKQVVHEESKTIPFSKGTFHNWSKELKGRKRIKCAIITKAPKLLVMLALGVSYRFAKTGQEEKLAEIIGSYSPRNLYPHDVFRLSYRLNKGNIYLSLLTIENVLARHWTSKNREARRVTTRLAHITNDPSGDNFGTWYHLYGVMLFGYTHGSAMAWSVGVIEGIGSGLMSGFSAETQENKINRIGAKVGGKLRREFIKSDGLVDFIPNTDYVEPTKYLSLIENDCSLNGSIKKKDKKREL